MNIIAGKNENKNLKKNIPARNMPQKPRDMPKKTLGKNENENLKKKKKKKEEG